MLLWPTRRAQFLTPRRGISKFRILDAFSSAPRRISGRVLVSASRGNLSTGSVRARSTRQRPEERGHSERTSGHLLVHDLSRQHTRIGTAGGGRRKRLKKSQLMGGESRGRVCVDEGVPQNERPRSRNHRKAGSKSNTAAAGNLIQFGERKQL